LCASRAVVEAPHNVLYIYLYSYSGVMRGVIV